MDIFGGAFNKARSSSRHWIDLPAGGVSVIHRQAAADTFPKEVFERSEQRSDKVSIDLAVLPRWIFRRMRNSDCIVNRRNELIRDVYA